MKMSNWVRLAAGVALVAVSPAIAQTAKPAPRYGSFGVDLSAQKPSVKPGDDFWSFANGGWNDRTEIAADRASAGFGTQLSIEAEANVRAILDDMAKNPSAYGASGKQVGDFYASWMDEAAIEKAGTAPLKPYLARIAGVNNLDALQVLFATTGYASPVELGIIPDLADPTHYTAVTGQGGLGMPRDYYLLEGAKYDAFRTAYRAYVQKIQELAGIPDAAAKADAIIALETAMAKVQWSPAESRDIAKLNDPQTLAGLKAKAPDFNWALMLKTAGLESSPSVLMTQNTAVTALGKLMTATPLATWKDYVAYRFVSDHAQFLPKVFDDTRFGFYSQTLSGVKVQRERWKRGIQLVNGALGEAVGAIYVAKYFPPAAEKQMAELIENLRGAYKDRITASTWMDDATKQKALAKLAAFEPRIGHPDKYIDYSSFKVVRGDLLGNAMRSGEFQHELELSRFGKPVDRTLWDMTPQTVNAYYNPLSNQITFPAAILQPPFFDPNADPAVNYGAIGAIIGHEMGHGFDDQGSQFGPTGKFENWWTDSAKKAFGERTAALVAQYDGYEAVPGTKIQGKLTLGENIGDLGGVEAAYGAFQKYQAEHGKAPVIGGLTGDQRFFLSYAQAWQTKLREDTARQYALIDPHSPAKFRVNGIVRNVDAWYKAFNIQPGDALYLAPEQRVHIW
ncbi:endothelin-converting enzyme/putative endopeptidase [Sphingomonas kyeonggiensis]|uniref:Endothelin-converting enzyme/putative endopeptidase n=1 Tax=Sphingomonas kyeonggiensis TaxID=1268553 RepID=A0A7W7JYW5_9SPHN|nr:M13 family metallopeptidase [Sphingomonas kyeonggiensis]MBB4837390.1 endothelin-converting enzyme/putative endopeptidase [Sphingomonas kyeonggiensis]